MARLQRGLASYFELPFYFILFLTFHSSSASVNSGSIRPPLRQVLPSTKYVIQLIRAKLLSKTQNEFAI